MQRCLIFGLEERCICLASEWIMERLINLPDEGTAVFVGDTHGDYFSARLVVENFLFKKKHFVVFLGDYVDRGKDSKKNIDYLLELSKNNNNLILLAGNHEMYPVMDCKYSDFWQNLPCEEFDFYKKELIGLPLAVSGNGFIALHGALPDLDRITDINRIENCDGNWRSIVWGDLRDKEGERFNDFLGRPKYGRDYFFRVMKNFQKCVLIRGHDPLVPESIFDNRCLTLFTSSSYARERKIAICDLGTRVESIDDIQIVSFDAISGL